MPEVGDERLGVPARGPRLDWQLWGRGAHCEGDSGRTQGRTHWDLLGQPVPQFLLDREGESWEEKQLLCGPAVRSL